MALGGEIPAAQPHRDCLLRHTTRFPDLLAGVGRLEEPPESVGATVHGNVPCTGSPSQKAKEIFCRSLSARKGRRISIRTEYGRGPRNGVDGEPAFAEELPAVLVTGEDERRPGVVHCGLEAHPELEPPTSEMIPQAEEPRMPLPHSRSGLLIRDLEDVADLVLAVAQLGESVAREITPQRRRPHASSFWPWALSREPRERVRRNAKRCGDDPHVGFQVISTVIFSVPVSSAEATSERCAGESLSSAQNENVIPSFNLLE